ncbi:hypothetical protein [Flavobacterium sp.]|uniref:hypothetical protein n=1 Tax=Flavobacterium sp. TaxID=239 RepID=UPI0040484560
MKTLKMSIKSDEGKVIGFKIDREVIEGLYITFDILKVIDNYANFKIKYEDGEDGEIATKICKKKNIIILNIKLDNDNHVQYLIDKNMCIKELFELPDNEIPYFFKNKIKESFDIYKQNISSKLITLNTKANDIYYSISS